MKGTIQRVHIIQGSRPKLLLVVEGDDNNRYFVSFREGQQFEFESEHDTERTRITRLSNIEQDVTPYSGVPL